MKKRQLFISGLLCMLIAGPLHAQSITESEYKIQKDNINQVHDTDKDRCDKLSGDRKDLCDAQADAKRKIALAELEAAYKDTPEERAKAAKVRADADYDVGKQRCQEYKGDAKDLCMTQAKAAHERAKTDLKYRKDAREAHKDLSKTRAKAQEEKNDITFDAEMKRCDSFAGDAHDACEKRVKQRFGRD
jgi:hypothetical protein